MKQILLIISILLIAIPCHALSPSQGAQHAAGKTVASCQSTGDLLSEEWEGAGLNGWSTTGSGTADPDYTTTVLRGSQSLLLNSSSNSIFVSKAITTSSDVWIFALYRTSDATPSTQNPFISINNGATTLCALYNGTDGKAGCYSGSTANSSSAVFADNTTYKVYVHYTAGTGSNAVCTAYIEAYGGSGNKTRPAAVCSQTAGTATASANTLYLKANTTGLQLIYDQVLVSTTEIGTVCE